MWKANVLPTNFHPFVAFTRCLSTFVVLCAWLCVCVCAPSISPHRCRCCRCYQQQHTSENRRQKIHQKWRIYSARLRTFSTNVCVGCTVPELPIAPHSQWRADLLGSVVVQTSNEMDRVWALWRGFRRCWTFCAPVSRRFKKHSLPQNPKKISALTPPGGLWLHTDNVADDGDPNMFGDIYPAKLFNDWVYR